MLQKQDPGSEFPRPRHDWHSSAMLLMLPHVCIPPLKEGSLKFTTRGGENVDSSGTWWAMQVTFIIKAPSYLLQIHRTSSGRPIAAAAIFISFANNTNELTCNRCINVNRTPHQGEDIQQNENKWIKDLFSKHMTCQKTRGITPWSDDDRLDGRPKSLQFSGTQILRVSPIQGKREDPPLDNTG